MNSNLAEVEVLESEKHQVEHDLNSAQSERTRVEETVKRLASRLTALNEELLKARKKMGQEFIGTLQKIMVATNDILQQPELRGDNDLREIAVDDISELVERAKGLSQLLAGKVANPAQPSPKTEVPARRQPVEVSGLPQDLSQFVAHRRGSGLFLFAAKYAHALVALQDACGHDLSLMAETLRARRLNNGLVDIDSVLRLLSNAKYVSRVRKAA